MKRWLLGIALVIGGSWAFMKATDAWMAYHGRADFVAASHLERFLGYGVQVRDARLVRGSAGNPGLYGNKHCGEVDIGGRRADWRAFYVHYWPGDITVAIEGRNESREQIERACAEPEAQRRPS